MILLHLDIQRDMPSCCSCNGKNTVCKHCAYAYARRPCTSCLSLGAGKCVNSLANRQGKLSSTETLNDVDTSAMHVNLGASDFINDDALRHDFSASIQVNVSYDSPHAPSSLSNTTNLSIDDLMNQAYGATLILMVVIGIP